MKEKIEAKINEVIESIIAKNPDDISYNEYRILDNKLAAIKWEEEQGKRQKELSEMMGKTFSMGLTPPPMHLPDPS